MYTAEQVSNWFLKYNEEQKEFGADGMSNLKIQKLLYYAQGATLALLDEQLFEDPIVAWKHGPVVESEYRRFKEYKASEIGSQVWLEDTSSFDEEHEDILMEVYKAFGGFSAWGLRELTHSETPWLETEQGNQISPDKIKSYFKENYIADE